jgi:hypothetical protein
MYEDLRRPPYPHEGSTGEKHAEEREQRALQFPNEPEMLCYQLLLRFDTHGPFRKCDGIEFLRDLRGMRPEVGGCTR